MTSSADLLVLLSAAAVLLLLILVFLRIARRLRRSGGSMTTLMFGATDAFYNKDKRKAVEVIVNQNAGRKLEEQGSDSPIE